MRPCCRFLHSFVSSSSYFFRSPFVLLLVKQATVAVVYSILLRKVNMFPVYIIPEPTRQHKARLVHRIGIICNH